VPPRARRAWPASPPEPRARPLVRDFANGIVKGQSRVKRSSDPFLAYQIQPCPSHPECCRAQGRSPRQTLCMRPSAQFAALQAARQRESTAGLGETDALHAASRARSPAASAAVGSGARAIVGSRRSTSATPPPRPASISFGLASGLPGHRVASRSAHRSPGSSTNQLLPETLIILP